MEDIRRFLLILLLVMCGYGVSAQYNITICNTTSPNYTRPGDPGGTTYTWAAPTGTGFTTSGSQTTAQSTFNPLITSNSFSPVTAYYSVVSSSTGTFTIAVTVNPIPSVNTVPDQIVSAGTLTTAVAFTGQVSGTVYQWISTISTIGIGSFTGTGNINSFIAINNTNTPLSAQVIVIPLSNTCSGTSMVFSITVNPVVAINAITPVTCSGVTFTITPVNINDGIAPSGMIYSWPAPQVTGGITGGQAAFSQTLITGKLTNPGTTAQTATYYVTGFSTAEGITVHATFTVTVYPVASINNIAMSAANGTAFGFTPVNGLNGIIPAGTIYSWAAPTITGGIFGGQASTGITNVNGRLTNPTSTVQTATYAVTPTSGVCSGAMFTVVLSVSGVGTNNGITGLLINSIERMVSSDASFYLEPLNGVNGIIPSGTTYSWPVPAVTGGMTGGYAGSNNSLISAIFSNPTTSVQTATFIVTALSYPGPMSSVFAITISVNPVPNISAMSATVCSGVAFSITPVNGINGIVPTGTLYSGTGDFNTSNPNVIFNNVGIPGFYSGYFSNQPNIVLSVLNNTITTQVQTFKIVTSMPGTGATGSFTLTLTVVPRAELRSLTTTAASNSSFTVIPRPTFDAYFLPKGSLFTWPAPVTSPGLTGGEAVSGANTINGELTNPTNSVLTATYLVSTSTSGNCGMSGTFNVNVSVYPTSLQGQVISTFAGNGLYGYTGDGGSAVLASLSDLYQSSVGFDNNGNAFIGQASNTNVIRKVDKNGIITRYAGTGTLGYSGDGGPALNSQIYHPANIAGDSKGNIYFVDQNADVLRKISSNGIISTIARSNLSDCSGNNMPLGNTNFKSFTGLTFDEFDNLYISDRYCGVIRKVSENGIVTTVAGNGTVGFSGDGGNATSAQLHDPWQVGVDQKGNIYIPDFWNFRLRKVSKDGIITTIAGNGTSATTPTGDGGPAIAAQASPVSVALDKRGNIYFVDYYSNTVRKIDSAGIITKFAGAGNGYAGDGGPANLAMLTEIQNINIDRNDDIYLVDYYNNVIRKISNRQPVIYSFVPSTGMVGSLVTIRGTNLKELTDILIGGVHAIKLSGSDSIVRAMVMPGAVTDQPVNITTLSGNCVSKQNYKVVKGDLPDRQQGNRLVPNETFQVYRAGSSVAVSADGNTAIITGFESDGGGAAWIYQRNANLVWSQQAKLPAGANRSSVTNAFVSASISADGNTVIVGDGGAGSGLARVYVYSNGSWIQQGSNLAATDANGTSPEGNTVSISADGNTAIIGSGRDNNDIGASWIFKRTNGNWNQQGNKLLANDFTGRPKQGRSIAISSDGATAIVGSNTGAWIFVLNGSSWMQQGTMLSNTDFDPLFDNGLSVGLSADGNTAIVGGISTNGTSHGAAWVYTRSQGIWTREPNELKDPLNTHPNSGYSVGISAAGETAILGTRDEVAGPGTARLYTKSQTGWVIADQQLTYTGSTGTPHLGSSVAISSDASTLVIGGYGNNSDIGAAWVFVPLPSISVSSVITAMSTVYGTPSVSQPFALSGSNLAPAGITVTASVGFEVAISLTGTFASSIVVGSEKSLPSTPIYVRISATAVPGNYSAVITISSPGASAVNLTPITASVFKKPITITGVKAIDRPYNRLYPATLSFSEAGLDGIINSDQVSLDSSNATALFAKNTPDTGISVIISGISLAGSARNSYTLIQPSAKASITAAFLSVTGLQVKNKVYDNTTVAVVTGTAVLTSVFTQDTALLEGTPTGDFVSGNTGNSIAVKITGYHLSGPQSSYYKLLQPTTSGVILPLSVTIRGIVINKKIFDATQNATIGGNAELLGTFASDSVSIAGTPVAQFTNAAPGDSVPVTVKGYTISGKGAANYSLIQPVGISGTILAASITQTGKPIVLSFDPARAATGQTIIIKGINFLNASSVSIGGTPPVSFNIISDTLITAIIGIGSSGYITVTNAFGSDSLDGFKYIKVPGIFSFSPKESGSGDTVVIKGYNFTGTSSVSFGGAQAKTFQVIADSVLLAIVDHGNSGYVSVSSINAKDSLAGFSFIPPAIQVRTETTELNFGVEDGQYSRVQTYMINGKKMWGTIAVSVNQGHLEISKEPTGVFTSKLIFEPVNGIVPLTKVYIRFKGNRSMTQFNDTIYHSSTGALSVKISTNGTYCDPVIGFSPVINSFTRDTALCIKNSVVLSLGNSTSGFSIYKWSTGESTPSITVKNNAAISLQVGSTPACLSNPSPIVTIVKNDNAIPTLTVSGESKLISSTAPYYRWYLNNKQISGEKTGVYIAPKIGLYKVETSLDNICWDPSIEVPILFLSVPLLNDTLKINLYPNPSAGGNFTIIGTLQKVSNVIARVTIVDGNGTIVLQTNKFIFFGREIKIPISLSAKGTYFVKVDVNGDVKTQTIIVQ